MTFNNSNKEFSLQYRIEKETIFLLGMFSGYMILLSLAVLINSGLIKALANIFAVGIFFALLIKFIFKRQKTSQPIVFVVLFAIYLTGISCSIALNPQRIIYADLLKILISPVFLFFGVAFESTRQIPLWSTKSAKKIFWSMVFIPLIVLIVQIFSAGFSLSSIQEISIFENRNNAAFYALMIVAMYGVLSFKPIKSFGAYIFLGVVFGTLGVLLSIFLSLMISIGKKKDFYIVAISLACVMLIYLAMSDALVFSRIYPVVNSIGLILDGRIDLRTVSFGELVLLLKTTDLSFLFRLKHWLNLADIFFNASMYEWLFGFGFGSSVLLSDINLVPHNDYIKFLFELGGLAFIAFLGMMCSIVFFCGRRWECVPLLAIVLYLFSENLVNNFIAMSLFYFVAGVYWNNSRIIFLKN